MITFADMMSLLMCFFVLLLANAETDIMKFKMVAGSMRKAKGPAIQAEAAPGNAVPMHDEAYAEPPTPTEWDGAVQRIQETLAPDVIEGSLEVEGGTDSVVMRVKDTAAFPSGSASMARKLGPLLKRIGAAVEGVEGRIAIAGHTDDRPIGTSKYRSNWELSASRSVTVAHYLIKEVGIDANRVEVRGFGDSRPLVPNDSREQRAINRRVEVILTRRLDGDAETSNDADPSDESERGGEAEGGGEAGASNEAGTPVAESQADPGDAAATDKSG